MYNAKASFVTSQGTSFSHQFPFIISCFFWHRSWWPFFNDLYWSCTKTIDFGTPSKSSGRQNGAQNRSSDAKSAPKLIWWTPLGPFLKPTCFQDPPETPRGFIFDDLGTLPGPISNDSQWTSAPVLAFVPGTRSATHIAEQTFKNLKIIAKNNQKTYTSTTVPTHTLTFTRQSFSIVFLKWWQKTWQGLPRPAKD